MKAPPIDRGLREERGLGRRTGDIKADRREGKGRGHLSASAEATRGDGNDEREANP